MVASMVMSGQQKFFRHQNIGISSSALAGYARKQWMTKPDNLFSFTFSYSSYSSLPSSSFPFSFSLQKGWNGRFLISRYSSNHGLHYSSGCLTKQPVLQPTPYLLHPRHSFHTSSTFNNDEFPWEDQGTAFKPQLKHSISYGLESTLIRLFTSVEFEEADFIEGSPEAFLYVMHNLRVGNMKDLEDVVTERGGEACRKLSVDLAGSKDLLVAKGDVDFLKLCKITYVKKGSENTVANDHLDVEVLFHCFDHKAYEKMLPMDKKMNKMVKELTEGNFNFLKNDSYLEFVEEYKAAIPTPTREFVVNFLVYLNDQQRQSSDWLIDNVHFKCLGQSGTHRNLIKFMRRR